MFGDNVPELQTVTKSMLPGKGRWLKLDSLVQVALGIAPLRCRPLKGRPKRTLIFWGSGEINQTLQKCCTAQLAQIGTACSISKISPPPLVQRKHGRTIICISDSEPQTTYVGRRKARPEDFRKASHPAAFARGKTFKDTHHC